jgi:hypothetical protein
LAVTQAVLNLGMHRSGTSCLAGSLQEAGLYLGTVNESAPNNAKGNRENRAIMDLQNEVLAANDGAWDRPPDQVAWSAEHEARRDALIGAYPPDRIWGFKDPRTLLTLEGWREALPGCRYAGTFRHPLAVAQSLARRNKMPVEKALNLWADYNRRLLQYRRRYQFDLIDFDLPFPDYAAKLDIMAKRLGLAGQGEGFRFFEASLRRNRAEPDEPLPEEIAALHAELLREAL